jgi:hypothetical protein
MVTPEKRTSSCVTSIPNLVSVDGNSGKNDKLKERIFPFLLEKQADTFNFADCAFSV